MAKHHKHGDTHAETAAETAAETVTETAAEMNAETAAASAAETQTADAPAEGVRARRAFMPKLFLPNKDWINVNLVSKGQGTRATIGRVFGTCFETQDKKGTLPNGEPSTTIALVGAFEAISYISGEIMSVTNAYLPMAYAEKVKSVFAANPEIKVVEIDCDIGLEATGKTIPYEWVVTAFLEGKEMERLKALRNKRRPPANLLVGSGGQPLQLTGPKA